MEQVVTYANRGLLRAKHEFNAARQRRVESQDSLALIEPRYDYGIILCAMRLFVPGMSRYYDALLQVHPHLPLDTATALASETLVLVAKQCRDELLIPVVAIDIAGAEKGYKASIHRRAFDTAHGFFFNKTVHAGEGFGPESVFQAVRDLHAERIGHGFHLFSEELVTAPQNIQNRSEYIRRLTKYLCDRRINIEVCLSSNLGTMPTLELKDHAFGKMLQAGISVSINTDNRLMSRTNTIQELRKAVDTFHMSPAQLKVVVMNGFKRSFYHGEYTEKCEYIRSVADYYDGLAKQAGISLIERRFSSADYFKERDMHLCDM
ncbi:add [Symbiodinium microadriaticum]|nr:add [Symbiodinium microadriaticum]